jgi:hypothetical protein
VVGALHMQHLAHVLVAKKIMTDAREERDACTYDTPTQNVNHTSPEGATERIADDSYKKTYFSVQRHQQPVIVSTPDLFSYFSNLSITTSRHSAGQPQGCLILVLPINTTTPQHHNFLQISNMCISCNFGAFQAEHGSQPLHNIKPISHKLCNAS